MIVPMMTGAELAFWLAAPLLILCALGMVLSRKPLPAVLFFSGVLLSLAILYGSLAAPQLVAAQILVYAVAVVPLLVITARSVGETKLSDTEQLLSWRRIPGLVGSIGLLGLLIWQLKDGFHGNPAGFADAVTGEQLSVAELIFGRFSFVLVMLGVLVITVTAVAYVLTNPEPQTKEAASEQKISDAEQLSSPKPVVPPEATPVVQLEVAPVAQPELVPVAQPQAEIEPPSSEIPVIPDEIVSPDEVEVAADRTVLRPAPQPIQPTEPAPSPAQPAAGFDEAVSIPAELPNVPIEVFGYYRPAAPKPKRAARAATSDAGFAADSARTSATRATRGIQPESDQTVSSSHPEEETELPTRRVARRGVLSRGSSNKPAKRAARRALPTEEEL